MGKLLLIGTISHSDESGSNAPSQKGRGWCWRTGGEAAGQAVWGSRHLFIDASSQNRTTHRDKPTQEAAGSHAAAHC